MTESTSGSTSGPLVVSQTYHVVGNLALSNGGLTVLPGGFLNVSGTVTLSGPLVVVLDISSGSVILPVLQSDAIVGDFSSVSAIAPACSVATATISQSGSTLSVLASVDSSGCNSGGLSTAAIVGITIGAAVGVTVLVAAILCKIRYDSNKSTSIAMARLKSGGE